MIPQPKPPREPYYMGLIIEAPHLQTLKHKFSSSLLTFLFWVFWFYLWHPLISIIAWFFGFSFFYDNMIHLGGLAGFLKLVGTYALVVFIIALLFFGWAAYNNWRFKNKKRRGKMWKIGFRNLGERYMLSEEQVLNAKTSRRLVVHFNAAGRIVAFTNHGDSGDKP